MTQVINAKKSRQRFVVIIILVILIGLLGLNYYYYLKLTDLQNRAALQDSYNNKINQLLELNTIDNKILNNDVIAVKNALQAGVEQITNLQSYFNELFDSRKNPDLNIKMLNIENLINLANIKLKLDYDVKTAITILNIAKQSIQNNNQPDLINLRKKILTKISQLEQVKLPDLMKVTTDLEGFISKIDAITIVDLMEEKSINNINSSNLLAQNEADAKNNWPQVFNNLRSELFGLVRIRKIDDKDSAKIIKLLDEQQFNILKLYFKLRATQAIVSLKQRDVQSYLSALSDLNSQINFYFVNNEQLRLSLHGLLKPNININLTPDLPAIGDIYPSVNIMNIN